MKWATLSGDLLSKGWQQAVAQQVTIQPKPSFNRAYFKSYGEDKNGEQKTYVHAFFPWKKGGIKILWIKYTSNASKSWKFVIKAFHWLKIKRYLRCFMATQLMAAGGTEQLHVH